MANKSHPRESPTKRDKQSEHDESSTDPPATMGRTGDKSIRHVLMDGLFPGSRIKVIISLPKSESPIGEINMAPVFSSESDNLESTTKGDLQFSHEGSSSYLEKA